MESKVIDFNEYKREKGIALPRSPYYTLNATDKQIRLALRRAVMELNRPESSLYAAVVGYEDVKTGRVKLLKNLRLYSNSEAFENMAGIKGHRCVGLTRKA